ncbi:diguanylate cyclase [Candidatus Desantisbacteria bacterium]|nr:diguanylate cyclase [Candidatus Desantisbacteria bacterium]
MKFLIADDEKIFRMILQETLENWGHEVLAVENGEEAWNGLKTYDVKFLILDWEMPVMDGVDLCRKIRAANVTGYIYIILLTGKDEKEDIIKGIEAGADDYIIKPFNKDELRVKIRTGMRILDLEKELVEKNEKLNSLNSKLEKLIRLDTLMEIGNRRSFYESIEKVHHRACRYSQIYSMIMCDIDNFKSYNDNYGHLAGDRILKTVAEKMKSILRISDDIFRYGGEELVIILPEQDIGGAILAAERIRKSIESLSIEHKGSNRGILTLSFGIGAFDKKNHDSGWEKILDFADKALYMAKAAGKNTVCKYNE